MSRGNFTACPGRWEPSGRLLFPAPDDWGTRTAAGGFAPTGRRVFRLKSSGELRSAERGDSPRPAAGAKRKGHLRFPFLFGLLPFPCFLIWRRFPICDRCEMGERQRIFSSAETHCVRSCIRVFAASDTIILLHRRATLHWVRHNSAARFISALLRTVSAKINCTKRLIRRCCP